MNAIAILYTCIDSPPCRDVTTTDTSTDKTDPFCLVVPAGTWNPISTLFVKVLYSLEKPVWS